MAHAGRNLQVLDVPRQHNYEQDPGQAVVIQL